MAFERLGDVIDKVLAASGIDVGNGAAATAPNAGKGAPTEAGASWEDNILHASVSHAYREIAVATPAPRRASPTRAAAISLYVIDGMGGSRGRKEKAAPAAYRAAVRGGDARETVLRLVHARPS